MIAPETTTEPLGESSGVEFRVEPSDRLLDFNAGVSVRQVNELVRQLNEARAELAAMKAGMIQRVGQKFLDGFGSEFVVVGREPEERQSHPWLLSGSSGNALHFNSHGHWLGSRGGSRRFDLVGPAPDELADLKAALSLANADLQKLDLEHRRLLRKQREANPEPDDELRHCLSIPAGFCSPHERPFAERELFDERMQEEVEKREGRNYILRVRLCNFESIPKTAKGSIGVDREWTADLILGSVREFSLGTIQASYRIEVI